MNIQNRMYYPHQLLIWSDILVAAGSRRLVYEDQNDNDNYGFIMYTFTIIC